MEKNKESIKIRQSNLELLRILSILMIIMHHYAYYIDTNCKIIGLTLNNVIIDYIYIGCKIGVTIFFMISGYFGIKSSFKIKKMIKLIMEVFFYSMSFFVISILINGFQNVDTNMLVKSLFPITHNLYWFATIYVILYIFSPYINKMMNGLNSKERKILVAILVLLVYFVPSIPGTSLELNSNIVVAIAVYIIGAHIMLEKNKRKGKIRYLVTFFLCIIFIFLTQLVFEYKEVNEYINYFTRFNNIIVLISSLNLFMLFININIQSKVINTIAKTTFGVYLIHSNYFMHRFIWGKVFKNDQYYINNDYKILIHVAISVILTYTICVAIDLFRIYIIEKYTLPVIYKIYDKLEEVIKKTKIYKRWEEV